MAFVCHDAPMPCIAGTNECATFEILRNLKTHLNWIDEQLLADSVERKTLVLKTQGFLDHLFYRISSYISGTDSVRFVLYSAHDATFPCTHF